MPETWRDTGHKGLMPGVTPRLTGHHARRVKVATKNDARVEGDEPDAMDDSDEIH